MIASLADGIDVYAFSVLLPHDNSIELHRKLINPHYLFAIRDKRETATRIVAVGPAFSMPLRPTNLALYRNHLVRGYLDCFVNESLTATKYRKRRGNRKYKMKKCNVWVDRWMPRDSARGLLLDPLFFAERDWKYPRFERFDRLRSREIWEIAFTMRDKSSRGPRGRGRIVANVRYETFVLKKIEYRSALQLGISPTAPIPRKALAERGL